MNNSRAQTPQAGARYLKIRDEPAAAGPRSPLQIVDYFGELFMRKAIKKEMRRHKIVAFGTASTPGVPRG